MEGKAQGKPLYRRSPIETGPLAQNNLTIFMRTSGSAPISDTRTISVGIPRMTPELTWMVARFWIAWKPVGGVDG